MEVTPSVFGIYHVCKRECWLHANGIRMEHTSDIVYEGKLLSENAYPQKSEKYTELKVENGKIDFFDPENHVIYEIKKSPKQEDAHIWQVKHYIFLVNKLGLMNVQGILSYPRQKKQTEVLLSDDEVAYIEQTLADVKSLINQPTCPPVINQPICRNCSYCEFCYG